jgi:hypothetical protein
LGMVKEQREDEGVSGRGGDVGFNR